jgi:predicted nuclease of predicted toxin-antitoxin system
MKILVDMNLSPEWILALNQAGFEAIHWSTVGDLDASDEELLA